MLAYKKIARLVMLSGKKQVAVRQLNKCLSFLKLFFKVNPFFIFKKALSIITPCFELKKAQKGSQANYVLHFSKFLRRQTVGIRWLASFSKSGSKFYKQLAVELFNLSSCKGKAFDKKTELIRKAEIFKNNLFKLTCEFNNC
jgi:ribosomal protein S7